MGVTNGQAVNALITNAAFLNKNQADTMTFPLALTANLALAKRDEASAATLNAMVSTSTIVKITGTVTTINGAVAPAVFTDGSLLIVTNASSNAVTINHESGSATAANRFSLPSLTALVLQAGQAASFFYDTTSARWRASAGSGSGGGLSAWAASFAYVAGNVVTYSTCTFICLTSNTSGATFEADYALGYWKQLDVPVIAKNLMAVGSNFESNSVSGWQLCNTTLTSGIPTGALTLGSATGLSVAATSSSPLSGQYSLAAGNTASTNIAAGSGISSQAFAIELQDQARVLQFRFAYKANANSGTNPMVFAGTSSNTWAAYIYDVTNSAWIQPAGVYNLVQSSGVGICSGTFQTPSNMTSFRLVLLCINATGATTPAANTYQMYFDEFYAGQQSSVLSAAVSDAVAYTPTFTGFTVSSSSIFSRRVGDVLQVWGTFAVATSSATQARLSLGYNGANSNVTIDSTKLASTVVVGVVGSGAVSASSFYATAVGGTSYLTFSLQNATAAGLTAQNGSAVFGVATYSVEAQVPIQGWSSNAISSADTDSRVVAFEGTKTATQAVTADVTNITTTTTNLDTHGAWSGSAYTVPVAGSYYASISTGDSAAGIPRIDVYINSVLYQPLYVCGSGLLGSGSCVLPSLKAGDTISFRSHSTLTLQANGQISIFRISGPATITATETVAMRYTNTAGTALTTSATPANIPFATKTYDTHGFFSGTVATLPVSGKWRITSGLISSAITLSTTQEFRIVVVKNGTIVATAFQLGNGGAGNAQNTEIQTSIDGLAGDTLEIRARISTAASLSTTANDNWICIERIGN